MKCIFLGFWLIFQILFVGASSKETTMTYIVFSKLSNSRICIICIYIPKFTNVNIIMYHFFSISNSHSYFNSIQLSPRRNLDCALLFAPFFTCYCKHQHKSTCIVDGMVGGCNNSNMAAMTCQWRAGSLSCTSAALVYFFWGVNKRISRNQ